MPVMECGSRSRSEVPLLPIFDTMALACCWGRHDSLPSDHSVDFDSDR
jgi:hypothetical protein